MDMVGHTRCSRVGDKPEKCALIIRVNRASLPSTGECQSILSVGVFKSLAGEYHLYSFPSGER